MKTEKTYTLSKNQEKIQSLSLGQLRDLYDTLETFLVKEQQPVKVYGQKASEIEISLQKNIPLDKDDDAFRVYYSITTSTGEIEWLSYHQLTKLSHMLLLFLKHNQFPFPAFLRSSKTKKNEIPVITEENQVYQPASLPEDISINKYIHCSNMQPSPQVSYSISGNGQWINDLSPAGIRKFQRRLRLFLLKEDV